MKKKNSKGNNSRSINLKQRLIYNISVIKNKIVKLYIRSVLIFGELHIHTFGKLYNISTLVDMLGFGNA